MALINEISIKSKLNKAMTGKKFEGLARSAANTRFVFAKQNLLEEYDDDKVVKELSAASSNPSIQGSSIVSKGNIIAFLGLPPGSHPEEGLRDYLKNNISMDNKAKIEVTNNAINFGFKVNVPSKTTLNSYNDENNKLPWSSRNFIDIIENGVNTGVQQFIFWSKGFLSNSISGTGLESKGKVSNVVKFTPVKFLTNLLTEFKERFSK